MKRRAVALALVAACAGPLALAQDDAPAPLPDWAPSWEVGDWWEVRTFQKDLRQEMSSPAPAEGATPRIPEDPRSAPSPTSRPSATGSPRGYKAGNRFRLTVVRQEEVRYPDDVPGTDAPERFWVVALESQEGSEPRKAELWFSTRDLALSKVVYQEAEHWLEGTAQLAVPLSSRLGFPLDWPDLPAARRATGKDLHGGRHAVEQRVRKVGEGAAQEVEVLLQVPPQKAGAPVRVRSRLTFAPNKPYWTRIMSGLYVAELVATSDD